MNISKISNPREFAFLILTHTPVRMHISDFLSQNLNITSLNNVDKRLATDLVLNCIRRQGTLDTIISMYSKYSIKSLTLNTLTILRLGVYQLRFMDRIPAFATVNEAVKLTKRYNSKKSSGFVNAVLRTVIRSAKKIDEYSASLEPMDRLAFTESHPVWLLKYLHTYYSLDQIALFCHFNNQVPPLTLRVNTRKISIDGYAQLLNSEHIDYCTSAYHPHCFRLTACGDIRALPGYAEGLFVIQDETPAMLIDLLDLCATKPLAILDLCASPGGKTSYLDNKIHPDSTILAVDISKEKIQKLTENIQRLHIKNVKLVCADATDLSSLRSVTEDARFDVIVVDAPCSNTGVLRKRVEARWRLTESDLKRLKSIQKSMLKNALSLLKPTGHLLYSTCSIIPQENQHVVNAVIQSSRAIHKISQTLVFPQRIDSSDGGFGAHLAMSD